MPPREFILNRPVIQKNRVIYSWSPQGPFTSPSYYVEYPDLSEIKSSPGKLAEGYLAVCVALAALGEVRLTLPVQLDGGVLDRWRHLIQIFSRQLFRRPGRCLIENGQEPPAYETFSAEKTALFFGGGAESLLALARLLESGVTPFLISAGGPGWRGSDPEINPDKSRLDGQLASDLGLQVLRIRTNFRQIVGASLMNAALFTPLFISLSLPLCERFALKRLVQGHERMNDPKDYFCFSPPAAAALEAVAFGVSYESRLNDLYKQNICHELYTRHPALLRYQYSCWKNKGERWCHECEACFRYFLLLKIEGIRSEEVGLDSRRIFSNLPKILRDVLRSPECYPNEIWGYLYNHPALRKEDALRKILDRLKFQAGVFKVIHDVYLKMRSRFFTPPNKPRR